MASLKREVDRILKRATSAEHGCTVVRSGSGHWKVSRPGFRSVTVAHSPNDARALRNIRADFKRYLDIVL